MATATDYHSRQSADRLDTPDQANGGASPAATQKPNSAPLSCYLSVILSVFLTASYCWAVWWLSGFFWTLNGIDQNGTMSMLSLALIAPISTNIWLIALHWQLAALFVLVLNLFWTARLLKSSATAALYIAPLSCQTAWILGCLLLHLVGILASVVAIGYVLE